MEDVRKPEAPKKSLHELIKEMSNDPEHLKRVHALAEEWKPNPDNSCKSEGCKGEVVQRVAGATSMDYFYHTPACNVCRREYMEAKDVRITGIKEFQELMNTPFGL